METLFKWFVVSKLVSIQSYLIYSNTGSELQRVLYILSGFLSLVFFLWMFLVMSAELNDE